VISEEKHAGHSTFVLLRTSRLEDSWTSRLDVLDTAFSALRSFSFNSLIRRSNVDCFLRSVSSSSLRLSTCLRSSAASDSICWRDCINHARHSVVSKDGTRNSSRDEIPERDVALFATPDGGVPWDDLPKILRVGQRQPRVQNSQKILPKVSIPLSRAHKRYRRQTDLR